MVAAAYAEKLRGSYWVRNLTWEDIREMYDGIPPSLRASEPVAELGHLIDDAARLDRRADKFESDLPLAKMDFDRVPVLK
jgi:Ca-activated chloride channel family protein